MTFFANRRIVLNLFIALIVFASIGSAIYFYRELNTLKRNTSQSSDSEVAELTKKVSEHMVLPENETPSVMTVADKEKLKGQPFFDRAAVGDKVLVYAVAKKAILYSPTQDKIIDVSSINLGADTATKPAVTSKDVQKK